MIQLNIQKKEKKGEKVLKKKINENLKKLMLLFEKNIKNIKNIKLNIYLII